MDLHELFSIIKEPTINIMPITIMGISCRTTPYNVQTTPIPSDKDFIIYHQSRLIIRF